LPPVIQLEEMYKGATQDVFPQCLACKEGKHVINLTTFNVKDKHQVKVMCSLTHVNSKDVTTLRFNTYKGILAKQETLFFSL
jgi:hypothetical protein